MTEIKTDTQGVTNEDVEAALRAYVAGLSSGLPEMPEPTMVRAWRTDTGVVVLRSPFADPSYSHRRTIEAWLSERGYALVDSQDVDTDEMMGYRATMERYSAPETVGK